MTAGFTPKVVSSAAMTSGDTVYLTVADQWTSDLSKAEILIDEAHAQLRLLEAQQQGFGSITPSLIDART